jgi:hypothetical protein
MSVRFDELYEAFEFISFSSPGEHLAWLDRFTGQTWFLSEHWEEDVDPLPEDIDEDLERYVAIPNKADLGLDNRLALGFAEEVLSPSDVDRVYGFFRSRGAYTRFKDLLALRGRLEDWFRYEEERMRAALREWAEFEGIEIDDSPRPGRGHGGSEEGTQK